LALKLLHPSCRLVVIHHPVHGTIVECSPRIATQLNCPKQENRHNFGIDCFAPPLCGVGKVEVAMRREELEDLTADRSG